MFIIDLFFIFVCIFTILTNGSKNKDLSSFDPFIKDMKTHLSINLKLIASTF